MGVVVGILATAVVAVAIGFGFWFGNQVVPLAEAERGQCVDIQEDGDTVVMMERDCTEEHDAEVVHTGEYDSSADPASGTPLTAAICADQVTEADITALEDGGIEPTDLQVIAPDPEDMADGDPYVCYVEPDRTLTEPLL